MEVGMVMESKCPTDPFAPLAERQILGKMDPSEGIVEIKGYGKHDNVPFFVLEYLPITLGTYLKSSRPTWPRLFRYAKEIAMSLCYLHTRAINGFTVMHRDLKPDNIMIADGESWVTSRPAPYHSTLPQTPHPTRSYQPSTRPAPTRVLLITKHKTGPSGWLTLGWCAWSRKLQAQEQAASSSAAHLA